MKFWDVNEIKRLLKEQPFYNVPIEKPKIKHLKDTLKALDGFKEKQKSVWSNIFWCVKVCIFWKGIQYNIHWNKTHMLIKRFSDKTSGVEYALFFFRELQLITVLLLICHSCMRWSTRFVFLKLYLGFSFLIPFRFYYSLHFCSTKWWTL